MVDRDPQVSGALRDLLGKIGFTVTAIADPEAATRLATEKFFAICLVDLDTPEAGKGADVVRSLRAAAPMSAVLALATRMTFQYAVDAFRAGAHDVIPKSSQGVAYLRKRVAEITAEVQHRVNSDRLLVESRELHDLMLDRLMQTARRIADLEDRMSVVSSMSLGESICKVLYVDDDDHAFASLEAALSERPGFALVSASSGGAALDYAGGDRYHVILVKESLPDLPGQLVARSVRDLSADAVVVLFTGLGTSPGTFRVLERAGESFTLLTYDTTEDLAARVVELREAHAVRGRERRYLRAFREQNLDLLRRHADTRRKMDLLTSAKKEFEAADVDE